MAVFCGISTSMADSSLPICGVGRPILRHLRRSKTVNVPEVSGDCEIKNAGVSFKVESSSSPQPTLSCQALRHAVSALSRIDDFILEELGDGFFANVYKATHKVSGEEMVMKVNKDPANRPSALREVQLMNKLSHPNILRFLGVCVHEGQLHALTEYVSGGNLEDLLSDKEEELPWTLRIKLSLDIAHGVHYLHNTGIMHRDLTSRNVLIKKGENRHYQAILADFGLAIKIPDPKSTEALMQVGCPWWMAPEVILAKVYNHRADLFSFGIINLEMIARIEADPRTMPRTNKFGVDYMKICEMVDYCPLDFLQLVFKCVQFEPEKRPSSETIISTLEKIHQNLHSAPQPSPGNRHKRSRSEDNILQVSDSCVTLLNGDDLYLTPQIMAQAMSEDDPHYCPSEANPFASISRLKDGHKLVDFPGRHRMHSGNRGGQTSNMHRGVKPNQQLSSSLNLGQRMERRQSQSLPSSPLMLRHAAEKLHQESLHGSEAMWEEEQEKDDEDPWHDLRLSFSSDNQENRDSLDEEQFKQFGCSRTRSLGSLDFFGVRGPGQGHPGGHVFLSQSERGGFCHRAQGTVRESSCEGLEEEDEEGASVFSESDVNANNSVISGAFHSCYSEAEAVSSMVTDSCRESLSSCSLSSFVSCEESSGDNLDTTKPGVLEKEVRRRPLVERKPSNEANRPIIATESGSYDSNHFGCGKK